MRFVNIGFNNTVNADRVVAVISSDSSPAKRLIADAKDAGRAIDCTCGRKTATAIVLDTDHVVLSALQTETVTKRMNNEEADDEER